MGTSSFFIAAGSQSHIATSTDGITWVSRVAPGNNQTYQWGAIDSVRSRVNMGATSPFAMFSSADGINWTSRNGASIGVGSNAATAFWYDAATTKWVGVGGTGTVGTIDTSSDGLTWISRTGVPATVSPFLDIVKGPGQWLACAATFLSSSTDGITWVSRTSSGMTFAHAVAFGNGNYVCASQTGQIFTSTDAITWVSRALISISNIARVKFLNSSIFVMGCNAVPGRIFTSTDGITWVSRAAVGNSQPYDCAYGAGVYAVSTANGAVWTATDGIAWVSRNTGTGTPSLQSLVYGTVNAPELMRQNPLDAMSAQFKRDPLQQM